MQKAQKEKQKGGQDDEVFEWSSNRKQLCPGRQTREEIMKSFEQWTREIKAQPEEVCLTETELPDGLYGDKETGFYFYCRRCDAITNFEGDTPDDFDLDYALCGGSPYCCP